MLARIAWLALPAIATLALAAQDGGSQTGDWMPWALVAVLAAGGLLAFDVMRLRRGLGLVALGCFGGLALWSGLSVLWAWLPGDAATEASRTLFYAAAFAIVLLAVRTQRDAATMVGLIAAATGLITLYGCLKLSQSAPESMMIYNRLGWPTGYPNTSAALGVLGFWSLVGVGAERGLIWPARALALGAAVPAIGFALLTQSRGAAVTVILVSPIAIALVRERLRLTAFVLVALAGLLPAIPALRTAVDAGTASGAGSAASRLLLGALIVAVLGGAVAVADQRFSIAFDGGAAAAARCRHRRRASCWPASPCSSTPRAASRDAWHSFTQVDATSTSGPHLLSVESNRWDFWQVAADDLRARPLTGYGAGSFGPTYLAGQEQRDAGAGARAAAGARLHARPARAAARQRRRRDRPRGPPAPPPPAVAGARGRRGRHRPACSRMRRSTGTGRCRPSRCPWSRCSRAAPRCIPRARCSRGAPPVSAAASCSLSRCCGCCRDSPRNA